MQFIFFYMQISFVEVVNAYYICRRNKRSDLSAIEFEFDLEKILCLSYSICRHRLTHKARANGPYTWPINTFLMKGGFYGLHQT